MNEYSQGRQTGLLSHQGKLAKRAKPVRDFIIKASITICSPATTPRFWKLPVLTAGTVARRADGTRGARHVTGRASGPDSDTTLPNQRCPRALLEKTTPPPQKSVGSPVRRSPSGSLGPTAGYDRSGSPAPTPPRGLPPGAAASAGPAASNTNVRLSPAPLTRPGPAGPDPGWSPG